MWPSNYYVCVSVHFLKKQIFLFTFFLNLLAISLITYLSNFFFFCSFRTMICTFHTAKSTHNDCLFNLKFFYRNNLICNVMKSFQLIQTIHTIIITRILVQLLLFFFFCCSFTSLFLALHCFFLLCSLLQYPFHI